MQKDEILKSLQIKYLTESIKHQKQISPFEVFPLRNELRLSCKDDEQSTAYLEQLIIEAEISLQNILYFYPHFSSLH